MVRSLKTFSRTGIITEIIGIVGTNASKKVEALIDTGAEGNYISERSSNQFENIGMSGLHETYVSIAGSREKELKTVFIFKGIKMLNSMLSEPEFIILDGIDYDAIIGVEVLQIMGLSIDMRADKLK